MSGHLQFLKDPDVAPYGLLPLHHNNQLYDYRTYEAVQDR